MRSIITLFFLRNDVPLPKSKSPDQRQPGNTQEFIKKRKKIGERIGFRKKNVQYLEQLTSRVIGLESVDSIEILDMTPGAYNLSYHVRVNEKKFIFRKELDRMANHWK
jgi:hypothetical protein